MELNYFWFSFIIIAMLFIMIKASMIIGRWGKKMVEEGKNNYS